MPTEQVGDEYDEDTLYMPNLTFLLKYTVAGLCLHNLQRAGTDAQFLRFKTIPSPNGPSLTPRFSACFVSYSTPRVKVWSREIQLEVFAGDVSGNSAKLALYLRCVNCPNKAT